MVIVGVNVFVGDGVVVGDNVMDGVGDKVYIIVGEEEKESSGEG